MFERKLRKAVRTIMETTYVNDQSVYEIIGKKVGDLFSSPGVNQIRNKVITYAKVFKGGEDFKGYYSAKEYLRNEGYEAGSMMRNYPIPFMNKGKSKLDNLGNIIIVTKYEEDRPLIITKFDSFSQENLNEIDGVIIPAAGSDMREGDIYVLFFEFPD